MSFYFGSGLGRRTTKFDHLKIDDRSQMCNNWPTLKYLLADSSWPPTVKRMCPGKSSYFQWMKTKKSLPDETTVIQYANKIRNELTELKNSVSVGRRSTYFQFTGLLKLAQVWPLEIKCGVLFYNGRWSQKCIWELCRLTTKFHSKIGLTKPNFSVKSARFPHTFLKSTNIREDSYTVGLQGSNRC